MADTPPPTRGFYGRFMCNTQRKVALAAGLLAILAVVIGAGFASMTQDGAATPLETTVVRWTAVGFLAIGAVAYFLGSRALRDGQG
jgi:hypothetical protein